MQKRGGLPVNNCLPMCLDIDGLGAEISYQINQRPTNVRLRSFTARKTGLLEKWLRFLE